MPNPISSGDRQTTSSTKRLGSIAVVVALLAIIGIVLGVLYFKTAHKAVAPSNLTKRPIIGFSMYDQRRARWIRDVGFFTERANQLGADVLVEYADSDAARQQHQSESLIARGVSVLVVTPFDADASAAIVEEAHKAGIKVIAYDRMITSDTLDYYVSFDSVQVGRQQAQGVLAVVPKGNVAYIGGDTGGLNAHFLKQGSMEVLDPKIKSGDVKIVLDEFTPNWNTDEAYKILKDYLKSGGKVDMVVAANDTLAQGAISALKEYGLAGKVPVSGQDADLPGIKSLVNGTQAVDVYKPLKALATTAADVAVTLAKGGTPDVTGKVSNGKIDVPSVVIPTVAVTKDNILDTVVSDGFYTKEQIYGSQP